jgi:hypothetical protein
MRNWLICGIVLTAAAPVLAQNPPFFGGGATAFDPEVSTVFSGALMDAQAVVSHDRRYVTLNMRATNTRLRTLVTFPVVDTQVLGFVGGADLGGGARPAAPAGGTATAGGAGARAGAASNSASAKDAAPAPPSPDQIARNAKAWVFTRQGIYLVKPLE